MLRKIESAADPSLRATVQKLVELVMSLHGAGLQRMLELTRAAGEPGEAVIQKLGRDELVASLLVLHGLHPLTVEERAAHALDKVRSRLRPHGAEVDLLSVEDGRHPVAASRQEPGMRLDGAIPERDGGGGGLSGGSGPDRA